MLNALSHISCFNYTEAAVRIEVMEQIPHVAVLCVEHRGLHYAIPQYILPVVVRYLTDPNNQVKDFDIKHSSFVS